MKLIGYCRVSTDGQAENTSLPDQKQRIEAYCMAFGHELMGIYEEIGSGSSIAARQQFQNAIALLDRADGLIATRLDRVARSTRDILTLVEDVFARQHKVLILLDLNIDSSTAIGKMMLTVMGAVAELERNTIHERCQNGRKAKAAQGGYANGGPRFGWKAVKGTLVPDPEQQATIKLIKSHRQSGQRYSAIARWLNEQGIPPRYGIKWWPQTVKRVCEFNQ